MILNLNENGKEERKCSFCGNKFEVPNDYPTDRLGLKMRFCISFYKEESEFAGSQKHDEIRLRGLMCPDCFQREMEYFRSRGLKTNGADS